MPVCPQCDNRAFATKEALLQHMRSSSAWHPFCTSCDRRFVSEAAYNAHLEAKHPRTFDCLLCNRVYHAQFALEDHYRGSTAHPNCYQCGRGFLNHAACEEHRRAEHEVQASNTEAEPLMDTASNGDIVAENNDNASTPNVLSIQQAPSVFAEYKPPSEVQPAMSSRYSSTGFTPLSPKNPIQTLIVGERRIQTPDLGNIGYSSPLTQVQPPLTPARLPPPGAGLDEIWNRKENRQYEVSFPHSSYFPATASRTTPLFQPKPFGTRPPGPPLEIPAPFPKFDSRLYPGSLRAGSLQNGTVARVMGSIPTNGDSGGTRFVFRPYTESALGASSLTNRVGTDTRSNASSSLNGESGTSSNGFYAKAPMLPEAHRFLEQNFGGSNGGGWDSSSAHAPSITSFSPIISSNKRASLFSETLSDTGSVFNNSQLLLSAPHPFSAGFRRSPPKATASVSSPASSIADPSPVSLSFEPSTRPTTVSPSHLNPAFQLTITPNSECPSPRSPEVESPYGLARLPTISPLVTTPLDLSNWDIPEALQPLPDSPAESTVDVLNPTPSLPKAVSLPVIEQGVFLPSLTVTTPVLESSSPSTHTAPSKFSPRVETSSLEVPPISLSVEVSPISPGLIPSPFIEASPLTRTPTLQYSPGGFSPVPVSPPAVNALGPVDSADDSEPATPVAPSPKSPPTNPLHCRACLTDSCDDITASMCGHIFCNRCIVDAVIKTNRCPVCMTPTLLYCLFRLDL